MNLAALETCPHATHPPTHTRAHAELKADTCPDANKWKKHLVAHTTKTDGKTFAGC